MIFSRFRKPQYNDPKPENRIAAIQNLDPGESKDKSKLHELAFNDDNADVSINALQRLDSFPLWLKMFEIAANSRVAKQAELRVNAALFEPDSSMPIAQRKRVLLETRHKTLIKDALIHYEQFSWSDNELLRLLDKLNDDRFTWQFLSQSPRPAMQRALVERTDEVSALTKLQKKRFDQTVREQLDEKIQRLTEAAQRPVLLQKSLTLAIAKLNALKDTDDYLKLTSQSDVLIQEINQLRQDMLPFLPDTELPDEAKIESIKTAIVRKAQQLKPAYKRQCQEQLHEQQIEQLIDDIETLHGETKTILEHCLLSQQGMNADELAAIIEQVGAIQVRIDEHKTEQRIAQLQPTLDIIGELASHWPQLTERAKQVQDTVNQFIQDQEPTGSSALDEDKGTLDALKAEVKAIIKALKPLHSKPLFTQWFRFVDEWEKTVKHNQKQQREKAAFCRHKLNACEGLIKQGKLKASMSVFAKVEPVYQELDSASQAPVAKLFERVQEQVNKWHGWQEYIAKPRKPALLEEAKLLAEQDMQGDVAPRSREIKRLRQQWNSLGKLHTAEDEQLNQQFDSVMEQAFAPCRTFYVKQDELRAAEAEKAQAVLSSLADIQQLDDMHAVQKQFNQCLRQWRQLGEIERGQWQELKQRFEQLKQPVSLRVTEFQQQNMNAKRELIAQALQVKDDMQSSAPDEVKQLQRKWQSIGFAGKKHDKVLWNEFRKHCDSVFEQLKLQRQQQAQQRAQLASEITQQISELSTQLDGQPQDTTVVAEAISSLRSQVNQHSAELGKQLQILLSRLDRLEEQIEKVQLNKKSANKRQAWQDLFSYVYTRVGEDPLFTEDAPTGLAEKVTKVADSKLTRAELTVRMEIAAGKGSPASEADLRSAQQLQVMAMKLQSGQVDNVEQLLLQWLKQGPIQTDEQSLLTRLAELFSVKVEQAELA